MDALAKPPEQTVLKIRQKLPQLGPGTPPVRVYSIKPRHSSGDDEMVSIICEVEKDRPFAVHFLTSSTSMVMSRTARLADALEHVRTLAADYFSQPTRDTTEFLALQPAASTSSTAPTA